MTDRTRPAETSLLERPVAPGSKITWWMVIYAALVVLVALTRLWNLAARAYCHDESIHAWESWKLATGQGYVHSPVYHGPFLYHLTALIFILFGDNDLTARLGTSFLGIIIAILPLFLKKWLGIKGTLMAVLLLLISPVMMHRFRFIRHDPGALVFNLVLLIAIARYLDERKASDLYWVAAAVALGLTAKETSFITYFIFGTFLAGLFLVQWLRDRSQRWTDLPVADVIVVIATLLLPTTTAFPVRLLGRDPIDYSQSGIVFSGVVLLVLLGISAAIGLLWDWRRWLVCAGLYYGISIPLYTTMFTNGQGVATGIVGQLGYWLAQHDVKRGGQPWYYYLVLFPLYEFLPILLGGGGALYYALRGRRDEQASLAKGGKGLPLVALLIYWSVLAVAMYSWAGEKMPWLMQHLALPLHLLAGWAAGKLLEANWREIRDKGGLWLLGLVPLFVYTLARMLANRPTGGTTTAELSRSMAWFAALAVAIIVAIPISRILARLANRDAWRMAALSVLVLLAALTVRFAWMATFINSDVASEFLVYAQGTPDDALVSRELETMSRRLTGGLHMKVAYDDDSSWPFVWYLRNYNNAQFYGKKPAGPFDAEVVIVGSANESAVKPFLGNRYYRRGYRLIWWPNQDWYMNLSPKKLWEGAKDPAARKRFWDVVFYRKHTASLTAWPFVHNFALYTRRDIAQQLWDWGPEAGLADLTLPGDEYAQAWKDTPALAVWGLAGSGPGQLRAPKGLDIDKQGNVYVADSQNHRIQVWDSSGAAVRQWGMQGANPGQFNEPWSVAVGDGVVYVADTWNHRIQVFDEQGNWKTMWGTFGEVSFPSDAGTTLYGPRDIALDDEGNLYVTDTGNKRLIKFDPTGKVLGAVGGAGDADGQMLEPVGVAVSADGLVYVVDTWNQRIQVFDKQLNYLRKWSVYTWEGMSVVNKPYIAVDKANRVYVTDPESYRVLAFDSQGRVLKVWGQSGADLSGMNLPTGIAVDDVGRIVVSDSDNHRLLLFKAD
ncbi:MAG: flippase activity-associated protein Agl23 [Chloroflexota bacterium]